MKLVVYEMPITPDRCFFCKINPELFWNPVCKLSAQDIVIDNKPEVGFADCALVSGNTCPHLISIKGAMSEVLCNE